MMPSNTPLSLSFSALANFFGVIGVIGSLIFVGIQLQQDCLPSLHSYMTQQR